MASESKSTVVKVKPFSQDHSSKPKIESSIIKKKIEDSSKKSLSSVAKSEVKLKTTASSSSKVGVKTATTKVREKKVFTLAGQKYEVPGEREPLRIFYESLSKQIPSSEMAEFWLMEHGLLSPERAKRAYEKKQRKQKQLRMGTPAKSTSTTSVKIESSHKPITSVRIESSQKPQQISRINGDIKAKKRIIRDSDDDDDDFIASLKRRKV